MKSLSAIRHIEHLFKWIGTEFYIGGEVGNLDLNSSFQVENIFDAEGDLAPEFEHREPMPGEVFLVNDRRSSHWGYAAIALEFDRGEGQGVLWSVSAGSQRRRYRRREAHYVLKSDAIAKALAEAGFYIPGKEFSLPEKIRVI